MVGDSVIQNIINRMLREEVLKAFEEAVKEDLTPKPGWQGFTGVRGIFDEWEFQPPLPSLSWTPDEFTRMWSTLTRESRVAYVKSLIL